MSPTASASTRAPLRQALHSRRLPELPPADPASEPIERDGPWPADELAKLSAADIARSGLAPLDGLDRLTAFADNLVPHVLRVDGVLRLDPGLEQRIEAENLLEH